MNKQPDRKRMQVFRASEGIRLDHDVMPWEGMDEATMAGMAKLAQVGAQDGMAEKTVVLFREPGECGMSMMYAWFKSGYILPRHSHNADCLYYVIAGNLKMGSQVLGKGDGMFVPADAGYTYEVGPDGLELLEVRNATRFNIHFKGNDEAHWERVANVYRKNMTDWADETPPSEKTAEPVG